jgi:GT2 family glycosyltransferase
MRLLPVISEILRLHGKHLPQKVLEIWREQGPKGLWAKAVELYGLQRSVDDSYAGWIALYDTMTEAARQNMRAEMLAWPTRPLISILMPVYEGEQTWLERAISSVRRQIYPHWELCISDDASTKPHVRDVLERHALQDRRISTVFRKTNGHISANSNTALELATGDFVALLDGDDELPEHALFWIAREILQHPDADLIYSDEDKLDENGSRFSPYFKPDWNPALMLSQNMFSHLGVFRRSLVARAGGFRVGFEGSQDHDLVLRCAELSAPQRIRHVPRVLYHWRATSGSTATPEGTKAKSYAWEAGARAIEQHLIRCRTPGIVRRTVDQFYQVEYQTAKPLPTVTIVVLSAFARNLLPRCIDNVLARSSYPNFKILVAINETHLAIAERRAYLDSIASDARVRVLIYEDQPFNYSKINNWAIAQADGSIICLLNDDTEIITPDWLEKLVARVELAGVAAAGPRLYYPDGTIQHAGVILGLGGVAGHPYAKQSKDDVGYFSRARLEQDLSCVTAACIVIRRNLFEEIGGFDEELAIAFNDVDLCVRLRAAGWRIVWTPAVELYHYESTSVGRHDSPERAGQFAREVASMRGRWGPVLDADPFYNPNLSLSREFHLAFPPRLPIYAKNALDRSQAG